MHSLEMICDSLVCQEDEKMEEKEKKFGVLGFMLPVLGGDRKHGLTKPNGCMNS